jgi:hypothetical protein
VKRSAVGPLDRVLGATFGVVRGLALLGIAYIVLTAFIRIQDQPHWIKEARTLPLIQASAQVLAELIPDHGEHRDTGPAAAPPPPPRPVIAEPTRPAPAEPVVVKKKHGKKGAGAADRRALDRLFEATGNR